MFWSALAHLVALLLDLFTARRQPACAKDLEIAVLRHQLRVALRRQPRPRLSRWEQLMLALLVTKLRQLPAVARQHWTRSVLLVTPETVLRWHRDLVRRRWTFRRRCDAVFGVKTSYGIDVAVARATVAHVHPWARPPSAMITPSAAEAVAR